MMWSTKLGGARLTMNLLSSAVTLALLTSLPPGAARSQNRTSATADETSTTTSAELRFDAAEFARTFTHHTAQMGDLRIHYVVGGTGEPVVLLHGFPQSWYAWRRVMPILARSYTVIAPDMRGFGESSKPSSGYDKLTVAEDVYRLVRQLGHERFFVVGQDWGGPVATALAGAHSEAVRRLVNIEGVLPGTLPETPESALQLRTGGGAWWFPLHNAPDGVAEMLVAGKERHYLSYMIRSLMYDPSSLTEADLDEYARTYASANGAHGGFEYYRTYLLDSQRYQAMAADKLRMPVLAIGGDVSTVGGRAVERSMRAVAANVRGRMIRNCGHYAIEERPREIAAELLTFFAEERRQ